VSIGIIAKILEERWINMEYKLLIDGQWIDGGSDLEVKNKGDG
jgi:hypothetical protein